MANLNTTAQIYLLGLLFVFIGGLFIVWDWKSYLIGAFIMYVMCSVVLNKMKAEVKELNKDGN